MRFVAAVFVALCLPIACIAPVQAQDWPTRNVTIIVPFGAGGTADQFARMVAAHMQQKFGAAFVVENRGGAGGNLGAAQVAKAANDGYTLLLATVGTHAINPALYTSLPFDPIKDFEPIALIARSPNMLVVNPNVPAKTLAEFVAYLKANPDKLNYGSSGIGTSLHLSAELFQSATGTKMTHVPYRSSNEVMQNLTGGHIDLAFDNMMLAWPQAKAGTLRPLAVTSLERNPAAPDVPAIAESIKGFESTSWHGLMAPAGTPRPIIDKLAAELKVMLTSDDIAVKFKDMGAIPSPMGPADFTAFIAKERAKWTEVVKASGAKAD